MTDFKEHPMNGMYRIQTDLTGKVRFVAMSKGLSDKKGLHKKVRIPYKIAGFYFVPVKCEKDDLDFTHSDIAIDNELYVKERMPYSGRCYFAPIDGDNQRYKNSRLYKRVRKPYTIGDFEFIPIENK